MVTCQICGREFEKFSRLGSHLLKHKVLAKDYYDKYLKKDENEHICNNESCNCNTPFWSLEKGYQKYCCSKCSANSVEVRKLNRETCKKNYGTEYPLQSEEIRNRAVMTNLKKYGCEYTFQSEIVKKKSKRSMIEKYGVEYSFQNEELKEKGKQTCLKKYGNEHPCKNKNIIHKIQNTCMKRYGVSHPCKLSEIQKKIKETHIVRYGVDNIFKLKCFIKKREQTCLEKFGHKSPMQSNIIKNKIIETCLKKYGEKNIFLVKNFVEKGRLVKRIKFYNSLLNSKRLKEKVKPNFSLEDFKEDGNVKKKFSWICLKCNSIFEDNLNNGKIPRCLSCFPIHVGISKYEQELFEFIKSLDLEVEKHNRTILNGKELDIYIPSHNMAIEFNGLFWHSELNGKNSNYHLNKTLECQEKGIQLIHIFEDEWIEKREIIKSIIKSKLNLITTKIPARKCIIQPVSNGEAFEFLDTNHLQGYISGTHIGLFFNDKLVSILTYGKSRFNQNYKLEILRFCNEIDTVVVGSLSKLINHINSDSIITYIDLRYGTGNSYKKIGFRQLYVSKPNYFYMKDYLIRESRLKYQKHKLESILEQYDPNLTEWQNMQLNKYDRIWDCGNLVLFPCLAKESH